MTNLEQLEKILEHFGPVMQSVELHTLRVQSIAAELRAASAAIDAFLAGDTERALALTEEYKRAKGMG